MLDLSNNRLTGTVPALGRLTSLTFIDLSYNKLVGGIPQSLSSIETLTCVQ